MAISDRARDFWDRISPRERRLVVIAAVAAPLTIAIWLGMSIRDDLTKMDERNERTRSALRVMADLRSRGQQHAPTDDVVYPTEPLDLDSYITNAAKKANFDLKTTITPHKQPPKNGFVASSSSLRLDKMTIEQVKDFLFQLETDSKAVAVTRLVLSRDFREKDKLVVDLDVTTYAKEAKAGEGAGSGSAGSGSAAATESKKGS